MNFSKSPINNQSNILELFVLTTAVLVTLVTLVWLLVHSRYGIDLTDESHYLIWMANPWIYSVSVTQFGFIYHPLHLLFHGDITLLRQANILIIFGLAWVLCIVFFRATIDTHRQILSWRSLPMLALAAVTATCSLIYFCPFGWLATPSYNSLIFQALLLASIGLLLAEKNISYVSIAGWILIGVGGWLAFMAKPTSAAALGFVISVCLPLTGKFNLRLLSISLLTAIVLLIASAWVIDGSLIIFINRLISGSEVASLLRAKYSLSDLFRIDALLINRKEQLFLLFFSLIAFGTIYLTASEKKSRMIVGIGFALLFELISLVIISNIFSFQANEFIEYHPVMLILAVPFSVWAFGFVLMRITPFFKVPRDQWGIALYFAVLPHISAFGTANNYWVQGSLVSLFWVLAGLVILMPALSSIRRTQQILLPAVVSGQLITVFLLQTAMEWPYRQPHPFRQYDNVIAIGVDKSELILHQDLADYYRQLKKMASQVDFQSGTPVIDMTGQGPGTLYAIGAKAIGSAWIIGGFAGSDNMAQTMLNRVSCADISAAWLLIDPDSLFKLSPTILSHLGLNFEQNFELATEISISSASYIAGWGVPSRRLQLWKPTHATQDTIAACEKKRNLL